MDSLVISLLGGISYGAVLFLVAAGLSLVLGLMGIVNIAHGAFFMAGAYAGVMVAKATNSLILGLLAGSFLAVILGIIIDRGFLRLLYKRELQQILVTMGILYLVTNVHQWIYGGWPKTGYIPPLLATSIHIGTYDFPVHRLAIIGVGLVICLILWWLQDRTKVGAIVRAGMDDAEMVTGLGINLTIINVGAFALGALLAGFAGVAGAPVLGGVSLQSGNDMFLLAIGVVIVGGVGSIQGALAGAMLIGIFTTLTAMYYQGIAIYIMYILMIIVLALKPSGLISRR
jgi:branched-chain amino acid transport system permease protein